MPIHIGVLSDPRNFHAQKWSKALREAGAQVSIFSFDPVPENVPDAYQIFPEGNPNKKYDYFSYLNSGKMLADALAEKKVDVLNPLSITPFGVWAMKSGFHPIVASALGADILEYPKTLSLNNPVLQKGWGEQEINDGLIGKLRSWTSNRVFRKYVKQALAAADFVTGDNALLIEKMNEWFEVPPEKMEVLRWGVEEKLFMVDEEKLNTLRLRFNLSKEDRVIFSPRGAKPVYQPDIILRAFTAVLETGLPHLKIIFLSAGYEISSSTRQQALELEKRFPNFIFVTEQLPREEVYALWNLVDVFVNAPIYDGYSAALAEGRYIGAIPLVNAIPGNLEVINHNENGIVVEPFTAENLHSSLLSSLVNLHSLKARFNPPNRKWIIDHSLIQSNAKRFLEICGRMKEKATLT